MDLFVRRRGRGYQIGRKVIKKEEKGSTGQDSKAEQRE